MRLASGSLDQTVKVWDARTGQGLLTIKGHTKEVYGVAWSTDGQRVVATDVSQDYEIVGCSHRQRNRPLQRSAPDHCQSAKS